MNFISFKDTDEEYRFKKSDNIAIMIYDKADEVIVVLCESLIKCHKSNLIRGGSYVDGTY